MLGLPPNAYSQQGAPVEVVSALEQTIFSEIKITGTVTSPHVARLSPEISGLIAELMVEEGSRVESGDVLMTLDIKLAELRWQSADAKTRQAKSALENAQRKFNEAKQVGKQRGIAETEVRNLEAEVAISKAALAQAQADAAYQKSLVNKHQLIAPFSGVVSQKLADRGEWVTPGNGVLELVATDNLRLDFAVAEDYLSALNTEKTQVTFSINALGDTQFTGSVQTIVPVSDRSARTFLLRVLPVTKGGALTAAEPADIATHQNLLLKMIPGMSAQATLNVPAHRTGPVVPRDAVIRQPDGRIVVWTANTEGNDVIATENVVRTGETFKGQIEILDGITADAQVIVRGNEALQNGQKIHIK